MEFVCTTCCARKRRDPELLPAIERYRSRRIRHVAALARRQGRPLLILSGVYGLLAPDDPIPWYDVALRPEAVAALAPRVADQLARRGVSRLHFYARPAATPGWAPYHDVLARACADVPLVVHPLGPEWP